MGTKEPTFATHQSLYVRPALPVIEGTVSARRANLFTRRSVIVSRRAVKSSGRIVSLAIRSMAAASGAST